MPGIQNFSPASADARELWKEYLTHPELYPRDEDFGELIQSVSAGLQNLCHTGSPVLLLTAAGTGALECAIAALPPGRRIVVIRNGYFGQRLFEVATFHHPEVYPFDLPFGQPFSQTQEASLVKRLHQTRANVIIGVHLETSSTVLNDVALIGKIGQAHQAMTIIDGVSSIGSVDCPIDAWSVSCFVGSTYKALLCPTGLSFLIATADFMRIANRKWSLYYDISRLEKAAESHRYLWSPSVMGLQCLKGVITGILADGHSNYFEKLGEKANRFRERLSQEGFEIVGDARYLSPCYTAIRLEKDDAGRWTKQLKEKCGMVVGQGLGDHAQRYIRIGHYPNKSDAELQDLAGALSEVSRTVSQPKIIRR